jgi:hypothetical protein
MFSSHHYFSTHKTLSDKYKLKHSKHWPALPLSNSHHFLWTDISFRHHDDPTIGPTHHGADSNGKPTRCGFHLRGFPANELTQDTVVVRRSRIKQQTKQWRTFVETWQVLPKWGWPRRSSSRDISIRSTQSTSAETAGRCFLQPQSITHMHRADGP